MPVNIASKDIDADARRVFEAVRGGGVAIIHDDVGYAVLAHTADAVRRIYATKRRSFDQPTGLLGNHTLHESLHILGAREREMVRILSNLLF